jgi:isovaleryl-CoA dehydrogenase
LSYAPDALARVIDAVVAPAAVDVDRHGTFPHEAVSALGEAGILGLVSSPELAGGGQGLRAAADVVERVAGACGSTAMVVLMHYAAVAVLEAHGPRQVRQAIAKGQHLSTLAFSEAGSRSHFWAPVSTATSEDGEVRLDASKSWVTSAGQADSYVWSSRPLKTRAPMTLWLVPSDAPGLSQPAPFDGLGLRGNGSTPVEARGVRIPRQLMLGDDGQGLDIALGSVLPWFLVLNAAFSLGLMEAVVSDAGAHLRNTRLEHLGQTLVEQPLVRVDYARMRVATDSTRAMLNDTLSALEEARPEAQLRLLEVKAVAGENAAATTDLAMKVCGGAAFRKELGVERRFRDSRAARVMAPTTDALLDFVGRAVAGLPLLDAS